MKNYTHEPFLLHAYAPCSLLPLLAGQASPADHFFPHFNFAVLLAPPCPEDSAETAPHVQPISEFTSRVHQIIVLKNGRARERGSGGKAKSAVERGKGAKKIVQKDSRNVMSNLLRIFFKNILEVDFYGELVERALPKLKWGQKREDFYEWLAHFGINFKNYIRLGQIRKIFAHPDSLPQQKLLLILLESYLTGYAVSHCLTSKRIEVSAIKMHLEGLRSLRAELAKWKAVLP